MCLEICVFDPLGIDRAVLRWAVSPSDAIRTIPGTNAERSRRPKRPPREWIAGPLGLRVNHHIDFRTIIKYAKTSKYRRWRQIERFVLRHSRNSDGGKGRFCTIEYPSSLDKRPIWRDRSSMVAPASVGRSIHRVETLFPCAAYG